MDDDLIVERACATCGHDENVHEERDIEQDSASKTFCLDCDDWHPFVPAPD